MIITTAIEKDQLEIKDASFRGEVFKTLMAAPDRKKFKNGRFIFLNSFTNIDYFLEAFPDAGWLEEAADLKYEFLAKKKHEAAVRNKKVDYEVKDYPGVFKTKPFNHQFQAFERSKSVRNFGLFFEQGCGKTKVTIDNASYLFLEGEITAVVIVAPNGVHSNWINTELPIHCKVPHDTYLWNGKDNKTTRARFEEVNKSDKLKIYAFNVECFISKKRQDMLIDLLKTNKTLFVIDESQSIKNPSAKRTDFLVKAGKVGDLYKRILSGTPITNGVEDIFSQFKFLDDNILGTNNFYAFRSKYCVTKKFMNPSFPKDERKAFTKIISYKKVDELQDLIESYTIRVLKKDCLDLPEKIYQREFVNLTPDQIRVENEIREEGITYIKQCKDAGEPVTIANVLARLTKRQQVSCGYLLNTDDEDFIELVKPEKNPRLNKLKDLLSILNGKVIIWARFTKDVDYIMDILGEKAVRYDGQVSSEDKEINKVRFQTDDSIQYFVAKPIKGLTLTAGTTAIYYSNDFDLEKRLQSEDRNHRYGTKEVLEKSGLSNILYIDLEAVGTIDRKIITSLRSKKKMTDMILKDPQSLFMEN